VKTKSNNNTHSPLNSQITRINKPLVVSFMLCSPPIRRFPLFLDPLSSDPLHLYFMRLGWAEHENEQEASTTSFCAANHAKSNSNGLQHMSTARTTGLT